MKEIYCNICGKFKNPKIKKCRLNKKLFYQSKQHKTFCSNLNYVEHFLILASRLTGCILFSAFASLVGIPIGIRSSAIGLKICAITLRTKKFKSIIKKKKKKHNKIVLLAKSKLYLIEALFSKALIDSNISHDEFILINNLLKEYAGMKEETKNLNT